MRSRLVVEPVLRSSACSLMPCRRGARLAVILLVGIGLAVLLEATPAGAASRAPASPQGLGAPVDAMPLSPLLAVQLTGLTAADGATHDFFGSTVALSGDTALVGAPRRDIGTGEDQGAVYVFVRSGGIWSPQAELTASDGAADDCFGWSLALSGSGDTALVGSPVGGDADQGSAYVFVRSGAVWSQQTELTADDGAAGDRFGWSVALSGSGDTALVGAAQDDVGLKVDQGSACVFTRSGVAWSQQAQLTAADGSAGDYFGAAVALSGDVALIGALYDDVGAHGDQGSAYVLTRSGDTWTQQAQLTAADGAAGDFFGWSAALSGGTALVGAAYDDVGAHTDQGSAFVFTGSGDTWTLQAQLIDASGAAGGILGASVARSGNIALVGAPCDGEESTGSGSALVFARSSTRWDRQARYTDPAGASGDGFGTSVALSGAPAPAFSDTAVFGEPGHEVGGNVGQGSAFVYQDAPAPLTVATLSPRPNARGWNKASVTVALSATDDLSGVASTGYRAQGVTDWTPYLTPIPVATEGSSTWEYSSTDAAGHVEVAKNVTVRIDTKKPSTTAYAAGVKKGQTVKLAYKVADSVPGCGRASVALKLFKGAALKRSLKAGVCACNVKKSFAWRCTLAKGAYTVKVYATDIAGNAQQRVGSGHLTVR